MGTQKATVLEKSPDLQQLLSAVEDARLNTEKLAHQSSGPVIFESGTNTGLPSAVVLRDEAVEARNNAEMAANLSGVAGIVQEEQDLPAASTNEDDVYLVHQDSQGRSEALYRSDGSSWSFTGVELLNGGNVGQSNGIAELDGTSKVPTSQLPRGVSGGVAALDANRRLNAPSAVQSRKAVSSPKSGEAAVFSDADFGSNEELIQAAVDRTASNGGGIVLLGESIAPINARGLNLNSGRLDIPEGVEVQRPYAPDPFEKNTEFDIIAHRGHKRVAPENTVVAAALASKYGADSLEFDVHFSSDDEPVVIHDSSVARTTDGSGDVADKTLTQLKSLDAGSWFDPMFTGAEIPTLGEMLDISLQCGFRRLHLELKAGTENQVERVVQEVKKRGLLEKSIIQSFDWDLPDKARAINSKFIRGLISGGDGALDATIDRARLDPRGAIIANADTAINNPDLIRKARRFDLDVSVYTINNTTKVQELVEQANINRIITDKLTARLN